MRRYLWAALAGSLLFGGASLVSVIAGTAPASAQPAVSLYVAFRRSRVTAAPK